MRRAMDCDFPISPAELRLAFVTYEGEVPNWQ